MDEHDELQQKIADIANRYIQRTLGELTSLRELVEQLRGGNPGAIKDIEHLAHKIYGSGSMFGFEAVSEQARELELAAKDSADPKLLERVEMYATSLQQQVEAAAAARARGVQ
jgi:HPt (histidine-containing phosphotransfer) domain-containing protein